MSAHPSHSVITAGRTFATWIARCWPGAALLLLAGCALPGQSPADLKHVQLEFVDSSLVRVSKAWLQRSDHRILLRGHVLRRPETSDTTSTHLDVTLLDANGTVLRTSREYFEPRQIRRRPKMPDSADFNIVIEPWMQQTRTISIRAHEGEHP